MSDPAHLVAVTGSGGATTRTALGERADIRRGV